MIIDCTLGNFMVPGFSGVNPEFGTKKPDGESISARENNVNVMMPFKRQRPFIVVENSVTGAIEANSLFAIQTSGASLMLGDGAFVGCEVKVINIASDIASLLYNNITENLPVGDEIKLWWNGSAWKSQLNSAYNSHGDEVDSAGRNLFDVLGVSSVQEAIAALSIRCNGTGIPDFSGLLVGDYIDGIDLSAIPAENSGDAGQVWSSTYKNNRIVLSGFNTYKGFGSTEVTKNHLLFTFRNIPLKKRINPTSDNTGGYIASELRAFLEGVSGNGSGDYSGSTTVTTAAFMNALNTQLGAGHLLTISKAHSIKSSYTWANYTVFPPSELEVCGYPTYGDEGVYMPALTSPVLPARVGYVTNVQFPIFSKSGDYRIKRYNGSRMWWWEQTPYSASASSFCSIHHYGNTNHTSASSVGGCAPAFCVV
jgi:hypothetical protein